MKKLIRILAVAALVAFIAPGLAFADSVSYLQGQVNSTLVTAAQGQVYVGFAGQTQAGAAQSGQGQVSLNHADYTHLVHGPFGIVLGGTSGGVNANGANTQAQSSGYVQTQGGAGLALGIQGQSLIQSQVQSQVSSGNAN